MGRSQAPQRHRAVQPVFLKNKKQPLTLPTFCLENVNSNAPLAQLDRASDYGSEG